MTRRCPLVRRFLLVIGPLGHLLLFGPAQVYVIGKCMTAFWPDAVAWPAAFVAGYVPLAGSLAAAAAVHWAPRVLPFSPWYATALFVGMPLLFAILAGSLKCRRDPVPVEPRIQSGITIADW